MKIFYNLKDFRISTYSKHYFIATIGVFDGVHRGHMKILKAVHKKARENNIRSLVITFNPHPVNVIYKKRKLSLLISLKHRLNLIKNAGIDCVIVLRFDREISTMSAQDFINKILDIINIKEFVIGKNFFFGKGKTGSFRMLGRNSNKFKYNVSTIAPVKYMGRIISSTWIRSLIQKGDLKKASRLLSRPVTLLGTVIKGKSLGRKIGYPTANIDPHHEAIPPVGVYVVVAKVANKRYGGILNIGIKPTFGKIQKGKPPIIEVHIFNLRNLLYNKDLEITFIKKIRDEKKFKNISELKKQLMNDEKMAKKILKHFS